MIPLLLSAALFTDIPTPVLPPISTETTLGACLKRSFDRAVPQDYVRGGAIVLSGPALMDHVDPPKSVAELVVVAPAGRAAGGRMLMTFSAWLETSDAQPWSERGDSITGSALLNPVKVFDRAISRHLFDWDVSECAALMK